MPMFDILEASTVHAWEEILGDPCISSSQKVSTNVAGLIKKSLFVWNLVFTYVPLLF
jgi:hypothetical protein